MTQDLYYYETGYFTPENYHGYLADAEADLREYAEDYFAEDYTFGGARATLSCTASKVKVAAATLASTAAVSVVVGAVKSAGVTLSSTTSVTSNASVIRNTGATMSSAFTQTSTISHIEGADLFAMTNAALAADVARIRDNNIAVTSAFTQVVSGAKFRHFSSDQFIDSTISAVNTRVRFNQAAVNAAFSLGCDAIKIAGGAVEEGAAALVSHFDISIHATRKRNIIDCDVVVTAEQTAVVRRLAGLEAEPFETSVFVNVEGATRIRNVDASLTSAFTQSSQVNKIVQPSAGLTSTSSVTAIISHIEGADLQAFNTASLTADADRIAVLSSQLDSTTALTSTSLRIKQLASNVNSNFNLSAIVTTSIESSAALLSNCSLVVAIENIKQANVTLVSNSALAFAIGNVKQAAAALTSTATQSTSITRITPASASLASTVTISASVDSTFTRPLILEAASGPASISSVQSKFGGASLLLPGAATLQYLNSARNIPQANEDFYISAWIRPNSGSLSANRGVISTGTQTSTASWEFNTTSAAKLSFKMYTDATDGGPILTSTTSVTANAWNHIAFSRRGNNISLWLNGVRESQSTSSGHAVKLNTPTNFLRMRIGSSVSAASIFAGYIDEVEMKIGTYGIFNSTNSTYTQPTTASINDDVLHRFLLHFDVDFSDDALVKQGNAQLVSTAVLSAQAGKISVASSTQTSTATVNAIAQKNVVTSAALQSNGFIAVINGRIVPQFADLTSSVSLSVSISRIKQLSSTLSTTSSLTATVLDLDLGQANLTATATATITARKINQLSASISCTSSISCTIMHFDTGTDVYVSPTESLIHFDAVPVLDVRQNIYPTVRLQDSPFSDITQTLVTGKFSNTIETSPYNSPTNPIQIRETTTFVIDSNFTFDFWYNYSGDISGYAQADTQIAVIGAGSQVTSGTTSPGCIIQVYDTTAHVGNSWGLSQGTIYLNWVSGRTASPPSNQISEVITANSWNHYCISRDLSGVYYFFINGVLKDSWTPTSIIGGTTPATIQLGGGGGYGYYDEVHLVKGTSVTSNFSVPTAAYPPPDVTFVKYSYSIQTVTSTMNTVATRLFYATSNQQATATATIINSRLRKTNVSLNATVTATINAIKSIKADANLNISFALTLDPKVTRRTAPALQSTSTMTANAIKVTVTSTALASEFSQTTNNARTRGLISSQQASATIQTDAIKTSRASASLTALYTELAIAIKTGQAVLAMDTNATLAVTVSKFSGAQAALTSQTVVICNLTRAQYGAAALSSNFTQVSDTDYLRPASANLTAQATVQAAVKRIRGISCTATTAVTVIATTNNSRKRAATASLAVQAVLTSNNQILRLATANLTSAFTIPLAYPLKVVRATANLTAFNTQLTATDVFNIDPYLQLTINKETRYLTVDAESRLLTIDQENRVNIIKGYKP